MRNGKFFQFSLYSYEFDRRIFNPYIVIGGFELAIDRNGFAIHTKRGSSGYILGAGFWKVRL